MPEWPSKANTVTMIFTIGALYYLLANSINLTSPMNYISPNNYTTSTIISDSYNYTQTMFNTMEPYRNQFIIFTQRLQSDPSAAILFTYSLSFFAIASLIWCLTPMRAAPTLVKYSRYEFEDDDEDVDEGEDEEQSEDDDMDYSFNIYVRNRKVKWTPHPMMRRSMDAGYTLRRSMESSHKNE